MSNVIQSNQVYVKHIELENYGPYENVKYNFRFDENSSNPIPLILIGKNGSGKSIFLSHIVNAIIAAKQMIYDNCEVENGKVYKVRTPRYIKSGSLYSRSKVEFATDSATVIEWQLADKKETIVKSYSLNFTYPEWVEIPNDETSYFKSTFSLDSAKRLINNNCIQYFPSNRFEEPAWLNIDSLTSPVDYMDLKNMNRFSDRSIISLSTLKNSQKWLLDIMLDKYKHEWYTHMQPAKSENMVINIVYKGPATTIYNEIIKLLNKLFDMPQNILGLELGRRRSRQLSIVKNGQIWIPNLFQLSSGETLLLDLFLCIIKDFDLSNSNFTSLSDINGIVLIDEIDLHLHINLQKNILPQLIKLFPKIQFIITTHSPMFLLGMQEQFGTNGFDILEMPSAEPISIENFTEFQDLFSIIAV